MIKKQNYFLSMFELRDSGRLERIIEAPIQDDENELYAIVLMKRSILIYGKMKIIGRHIFVLEHLFKSETLGNRVTIDLRDVSFEQIEFRNINVSASTLLDNNPKAQG